jgi:thymidylate synthase (FAD)
MGKITIQSETTKNPITLIGMEAGLCWGADTTNNEKNYKRGQSCLKSGHMRTAEFPQVFMTIEGYSARVIREFYTHIGGSPTRLQESTRYINYNDFDYIVPHTIVKNKDAEFIYEQTMQKIQNAASALEVLGVPREDIANLLPLGMTTKVVARTNARHLIDMSHVRECARAYWEMRELIRDLKKALSEYSPEWKEIVDTYFMPKCEFYGFCNEEHSCGRKPKRD